VFEEEKINLMNLRFCTEGWAGQLSTVNRIYRFSFASCLSHSFNQLENISPVIHAFLLL
jgi:hypothetical protein